MFIDEAHITVNAGRGGDGKVSFYPMKKGPDGGMGGQGGNVYAVVNPQLSNLNKFIERNTYKAGDGEAGGSFRKEGKKGDDLTVQFPPGTTLIDQADRYEIELTEEPRLIARGGLGGRGNNAFKTSTHQVPREFERGLPGDEKHFKVIMRLIADYGLIGLPNAGKSSLLNELTRASVKTAPYPFTTLEPNLGALNGKIIADIPGLIEGASKGKGLGIKFLKHIEKVTLLLHCIGADSADMMKEYETVIKELEQYNPSLVNKEQIILLTKHDLLTDTERKKKLKELSKLKKEVLAVSIHDFDSLEALKKRLR